MFWWKRLKIYQSNTYNICSYEACVKVFITSVAYFSGYWQVADLWTQSTRNRDWSKLRIFEIDLLII